MWIFNYFLGSYILSSSITICYDLVTNLYKNIERKKDHVINCLIFILPNISVNIFFVAYPYLTYLEKSIKDKERNQLPWHINFALLFLLADICFYIFHILLHRKEFYFLHSKHHEFMYPIGAASIYAHPVDFFLTNLLPFSIPVIIILPNDEIIKNILILGIFNTVIQSHGGYTVTFQGHLNHHKYPKTNFGLGIVDRVMGTNF